MSHEIHTGQVLWRDKVDPLLYSIHFYSLLMHCHHSKYSHPVFTVQQQTLLIITSQHERHANIADRMQSPWSIVTKVHFNNKHCM